MSDPREPQGRIQIEGCGKILMALIGAVLLVPGLCSVLYGAMTIAYLPSRGNLSGLTEVLPFWLIGMLVGALGIWLIVRAFRR